MVGVGGLTLSLVPNCHILSHPVRRQVDLWGLYFTSLCFHPFHNTHHELKPKPHHLMIPIPLLVKLGKALIHLGEILSALTFPAHCEPWGGGSQNSEMLESPQLALLPL